MMIASCFGTFCTVLSFALLLFLFIRKLVWGDHVAGWPSLVCIILFVSGMQILCIGMMGKYNAKTYVEVKN
ncbi:glycosyltransferase, partial [Coprococcus eutactus]|nr:glycosyltransferase [Coprococcus eutactus]